MAVVPVRPVASSRAERAYRNRGDGSFEDVTARRGWGAQATGWGCVVGDYDNDGHDDFFVTGLGGAVLYRNRGDGTFRGRDGAIGRAARPLVDGGGIRRPRRRRRPRPLCRDLRRRRLHPRDPLPRFARQADPLSAG